MLEKICILRRSRNTLRMFENCAPLYVVLINFTWQEKGFNDLLDLYVSKKSLSGG